MLKASTVLVWLKDLMDNQRNRTSPRTLLNGNPVLSRSKIVVDHDIVLTSA